MKDDVERFIDAVCNAVELSPYQKEFLDKVMRMENPVLLGTNRYGMMVIIDRGEDDEGV